MEGSTEEVHLGPNRVPPNRLNILKIAKHRDPRRQGTTRSHGFNLSSDRNHNSLETYWLT